jgi:hypothetical protein
VPGSVPPQDARVIRSENRALLIASIARGRRWLNELIVDPGANAESSGPFSTTTGNLRNRRTAWWTREDSTSNQTIMSEPRSVEH